MRISVQWLSDYIDTTSLRENLKKVVSQLTMRGLEVESVEDLSQGFEKVVVAEIISKEKHPNADRLSLCHVTAGKENYQIVCGAQNMKVGDKVALSLIGAHLPNGMKIEKTKIRGVESFGMLCSETELKLASSSAGILILPLNAPLGENVGRYLGREDIIFEINVTPNRGDALSHIGVARELAPILGKNLKLPKIGFHESKKKASEKIKLTLEHSVGHPNLCWQYHGRYIEGIKVGPSPQWLVKKLQAVGLRPINNVVDITNFVLMEWGTPLHAFDFKKIQGGHIKVRLAKKGEKIALLDDTEIDLTPQDLVIADESNPVALAGVMGGKNSAVNEETTQILLEAAQFLPSQVRGSARFHQKHTDSSHRFERQVDARAVFVASQRAAALILEVAGGQAYAGAVSEFSPEGNKKVKGKLTQIKLNIPSVNRFLGIHLTAPQVKKKLGEIGFQTTVASSSVNVQIPSFRPDVECAEDLYEEVLRVWGYEKVEAKIPRLEFIPEPLNPVDHKIDLIQKLKVGFCKQGFCEAINFGFTSKTQNEIWDKQETDKTIILQNPLSEEVSVMKTSLLGGLFENFLKSIHYQQKNIRLFEIRPIYFKDLKSETGSLEQWRVSGILSGRSYRSNLASADPEVDFFDAKAAVESAFEILNIHNHGLHFEQTSLENPFHPTQSANISADGKVVGFISRLHPLLEAKHKLKQAVYFFDFSLEHALALSSQQPQYIPLAKFPKVLRDFSLIVPKEMPAEKVLHTIHALGHPLVEKIEIVDVYRGDKIPINTISLSVSLIVGNPERTLEEQEIENLSQKILVGLEHQIGVKLRIQ